MSDSHFTIGPGTNLADFVETFKSYSTRGAALTAVAMLDSALRDKLKDVLNVVGSKALLEYSFKPDGMFGGFGPKIRLAFLLGMYSEFAYRELKIIGDIRNAFVHEAEASNFTYPRLQGLVSSLAINRDPPEFSRRIYTAIMGKTTPQDFAYSIQSVVKSGNVDLNRPDWSFMAETLLLFMATTTKEAVSPPLIKKCIV